MMLNPFNQDQPCLATSTLTELMEGRVFEPDLSRFSAHLEDCKLCQERVQSLDSGDTLVEILRSSETDFERILAETPKALIEQLKKLPSISDLAAEPDSSSFHSRSQLGDEYSVFDSPIAEGEIGRFGDYRILNELGRGGMGVVFRAEEIPLQRMVAIKIMSQRIATLPDAKERFLREAKAAASLKNDHIVTIYRVDEFQNTPFAAMELLHGESMEACHREGERWSAERIVQAGIDISRGLAEAHSKGMIHRDIKPGNLWLETTTQGTPRVKILDFGLVRSDLDDMQKTLTGTIVGTPAFMSPEQARGEKGLDARADLFSLGCVLYLLSTGEVPFKSETTMGTLMALATHDPSPPDSLNPRIPLELSQIIIDLLQKNPADRPPSTPLVIARLLQISAALANNTATFRPTRTVPSNRDARHSNPLASLIFANRKWITMVAAIAFFSMVVFAGTYFWQTGDGRIVRVECNDPSISIAIEGTELHIEGASRDPISVKPGKVDLRISKKQSNGEDFEFETDKLIVRKGDSIVLRIESLEGRIAIVQEGKGVLEEVEFSKQTSPEGSADLLAVKWIQSIGGRVAIENGTWIDLARELPPEPLHVTYVNLEGNKRVTSEGLALLKECKFLKDLDLERSSVSDEGLKQVGGMTGLRNLNLYATQVSDAGMEHLRPLKDIKEICLGGGIPITDKGAAVLRGFPMLQKVYLDATMITDDAIGMLQTVDTLVELNVAGAMVTREGLKRLVEFKSLRTVCLLSTPLDDDVLKCLTQKVDFEELNLGATRITDNGLKLLYPLKKLQTLWLLHSSHSTEAIEQLHAQLPHCRIMLDDRTIQPE